MTCDQNCSITRKYFYLWSQEIDSGLTHGLHFNQRILDLNTQSSRKAELPQEVELCRMLQNQASATFPCLLLALGGCVWGGSEIPNLRRQLISSQHKSYIFQLFACFMLQTSSSTYLKLPNGDQFFLLFFLALARLEDACEWMAWATVLPVLLKNPLKIWGWLASCGLCFQGFPWAQKYKSVIGASNVKWVETVISKPPPSLSCLLRVKGIKSRMHFDGILTCRVKLSLKVWYWSQWHLLKLIFRNG